jgi:hypothetical protein
MDDVSVSDARDPEVGEWFDEVRSGADSGLI